MSYNQVQNEGGSSEENNTSTDDTVSLEDVLREQQVLENDAQAVLGGSDDSNCTYEKGYVSRQALYSCLTCVPINAEEPAGVCLACSLNCHDGHDLVELYTKRNFRCDCGNEKFGEFACRLRPEKDPRNVDNEYSQNFRGVYCVCRRPYPDPEDDIEDEMIQCVGCEDWFHSRHMGVTIPESEDSFEMICRSCAERWPFLRAYLNIKEEDAPESKEESKEKPALSNETECKMKNFSIADTDEPKALLFTSGWREKLCRCDTCLKTYEDKKCVFLTDHTDTIQHYEEMGRQMHESGSYDSLENGMRVLNQQCDRTTQIEMAHEYNDMKQELVDYLKKFAENKKVVREEDIQEFFTTLRARKRQRVTLGELCGSSSGV